MKNLAIVIPYYKLTFFRETLESLAAQTDKRFHVYIGNDASPEDPEELLKEFEGKLPFTYKKFDENLGRRALTKQWERCIEMMQGEEWFMILGDDDVLSDNFVEKFYTSISEFAESSSVIRYSTVIIDENGDLKGKSFHNPKFEDGLSSFFRKITGQTRSSLSEYIFNKQEFIQVGFQELDLAWGSDDLLVLQTSGLKPIFSVNDSYVKVRISKQSISGIKNNLCLKNRAILKKSNFVLEKYRNRLSKKQKTQIENYIEYSVLEYSSRKEIIKFILWNFSYYAFKFSKLNFRLLIGIILKNMSSK